MVKEHHGLALKLMQGIQMDYLLKVVQKEVVTFHLINVQVLLMMVINTV